MSKLHWRVGAMLLLLMGTVALAAAENIVPLDTKASVLKWTGHAEVGTYAPSGTLALREGEVRFEKNSFRGAHVLIDMNSMTQDNTDLLHHLKSADFFDVEHYPTSAIDIERFAGGKVYGTLTIRGKATPFESLVALTPTGDHFVITGAVSLDRTKYGIVYNSTSFFSGLGNKAIRNQFEVEFTLVSKGPLPANLK